MYEKGTYREFSHISAITGRLLGVTPFLDFTNNAAFIQERRIFRFFAYLFHIDKTLSSNNKYLAIRLSFSGYYTHKKRRILRIRTTQVIVSESLSQAGERCALRMYFP